LSQAVQPGARFEIAVLVINGPISASPANPAYIREARLEFYEVPACLSCRD
jgi:hypothetical protein